MTDDELNKPPTYFASGLKKLKPPPKEDEALPTIETFVRAMIALPCCFDNRKRTTTCTCFRDHLADANGSMWVPYISKYLYDFYFVMTPNGRNKVWFESVKYTVTNQEGRFPLPATFMKIDVSRHEEDVQGRRTKDFHTPSADREKLLSQMPEPLPKPGIKRIKQIELGTKWRKHVPPEFQDEICPVPSKAIVDAHKKEKKKTKKNKATAIQNENDSDDEVVDETPAASSSNTHQGEASQTLQWQQQQTWLAYQQILQQQTQNYPFFPQFNY